MIRNTEDCRRHVDYIHFNPVKHGYVTAARDWPYSSFHAYVERGVYPADWGTPPDVDGLKLGFSTLIPAYGFYGFWAISKRSKGSR